MTPITGWLLSRKLPLLDRAYAHIDEHALDLDGPPIVPRSARAELSIPHRRSA